MSYDALVGNLFPAHSDAKLILHGAGKATLLARPSRPLEIIFMVPASQRQLTAVDRDVPIIR